MQVLALPDASDSSGRPPGWRGWLLLGPMLAWLALFVVVPAAILLVYSFCRRDGLGRVVYGFSLENYARVFEPIYLRILARSIGYAALATALCILIGYPAAWFIARRREKARRRLLLAVMIPFWTSFLIRTYAWIVILKNEGLLNGLLQGLKVIAEPLDLLYTPFAVMVGLVYAYLPFMILPIYGCAEHLDGHLIEAAHDLGAGPLRVFREVILPLTRPGIAAGTLLVFVPAIGMFAVTDLMGGARVPLIGNVIQNQFLRARNWPFGSALGTVFTLLFVVAYAAMQGRRGRGGSPVMIELAGVTKRFGAVTAVDRVDLSVAAGEFLTLVGPSGCGKTTLLRLLSGFERPSEGAIRIAGEDVTGLPPYRRNLNQVFQGYALFPHLSVRDNIAFGLRMQKVRAAERAARVAEAVDLVELEGLEDRMPDQLSGGQRQRVALARAIAPRPAVLLLDEPLSALDAKLRQQMQGELKRLQRRLGMTFVFVTHDRAEALAMGDRIAVMNQARIEQVGPPGQVYGRPGTAFVADFISEANLVEAERLPGGGDGARVRLACGAELTVPAAQWPAGMSRARVSFRPERILVSKDDELAGDGVFPARVAEVAFHGAFERLALEAGEKCRLVALISGQDPLVGVVGEGDRIRCRVGAADLVVLPD